MENIELLQKWSNKRGGSTVIEIVVCISLLTFFIFYPVAIFSYAYKQSLLEDVLTTSIQMASVEGGVTDRVEDLIYLNMETKGLIKKDGAQDKEIRDKIPINTNADARKGNNSNRISKDHTDPTIYLEILYPANKEVQFLNSVSRLIGAGRSDLTPGRNGVSWNFKLSGYTLSEYVGY